MIDGCNRKLCVATHSLASPRTSPQKNFNAIARLFRDGSVRKYQLTFHIFTSSPHLFIMHYSPSVLLYSFLTIFSFLFNVFLTPLLYSPLNPFIRSTLYLSLFFCTPRFSHPIRFPYLYHTLYSLFLLIIPPHSLPPFIFLFISTFLPTSIPNFHFLHL